MKRNCSRRMIVFIMCIVLYVNLAPTTAVAAQYETTIDGIIYQLDDSTLVATVHDTTDALPTAVTIPSTVEYDGNTYNVTNIEAQAFAGCSNMTSISIPYGVTSVPAGVFRDCTGLTSVTIPNSVTNIGGAAFINCTSLTQITIPASVETIGDNSFAGCTSLTTITFAGTTLPQITDSNGNGVITAPFEGTQVCANGHNAWKNCKCYYCGIACDHTGKTPIDNGDKTHSYGCLLCDDIEVCTANIVKDYVCELCGGYLKEVPVANELTYNDKEQALVSVTPAGAEILIYSLDKYGTYSEEIPTAMLPGEYRVWFKYTGPHMNLIDEAAGYVDVTIKKLNYDMSNAKWDYTEAFTYDGSPKTVSVIGLPKGVTVKEYTGNVYTDVGKYTAKVTLAYDDSIYYNAPVVEDIQWEIKAITQDTDSKDNTTTQDKQEESTTASATEIAVEDTDDTSTQNKEEHATANAIENTPSGDNNSQSPQTGDFSNTRFTVVLMLLSATGIYLLGKHRHKLIK